MRLNSFWSLLALIPLAACAATAASPPAGIEGAAGDAGASGSAGSGGAAGTGGKAGSSGAAGASGAAGGDGGVNLPDGSSGGGKTIVYAHTDTTLFSLDPDTDKLELTTVGDFDCVDKSDNDTSMTDLAVDKDGNMWGVNAGSVIPLTIKTGSVACGAPIALKTGKNVRYYGLTFAPAGVFDPTKEVLVAGNNDGELWTIDADGNATQRGTFGNVPNDDGHNHDFEHPGKNFVLSGDIVFLAHDGDPVGYATVRDCSSPPTGGCSAINTLIEIDVKKMATATTGSVRKSIRGQILSGKGCSDGIKGGAYGNMFGIAAWSSKVFGFSRTGNLVEINVNDGSGCLVKAYPMNKYSGAGVTTIAPVDPPIN